MLHVFVNVACRSLHHIITIRNFGVLFYFAKKDSICESWFLIHQDVYHDLFVCS